MLLQVLHEIFLKSLGEAITRILFQNFTSVFMNALPFYDWILDRLVRSIGTHNFDSPNCFPNAASQPSCVFNPIPYNTPLLNTTFVRGYATGDSQQSAMRFVVRLADNLDMKR